MRHIPQSQLRPIVDHESPSEIAQLLGVADGVVRYLSLSRVGDAYHLHWSEVHDEGDEEFADVGEFAPLDSDADDDAWEEHPSLDAALVAAERRGARPDRWVRGGMLGDEYLDARKNRPSSG
jgi:hypothetical protein